MARISLYLNDELLFPVLLAVVLAIIFTPWYVGVFWASAVAFKVLNVSTSLGKVFASKKFLANVSGPDSLV